MSKVDLTVDAGKQDFREICTAHLADLDTIIDNIDTADLAGRRWAIKKLAQGQRALCKIVKRLVT